MGIDRHPFPPFPWRVLRRPLSDDQRAALTRALRGLLRFQRTLRAWQPVQHAPDATPFVSLYADGRLCGCQGTAEGVPAERVTRAFLRALHDQRFAMVTPDERNALAAQVSYVRQARLLNPESAESEIEVGTHGVALVRDRMPGVMILPHVARDERLGARELLAALMRKARLSDGAWEGGALYAFEAEDVVVHSGARPRPRVVGAAAAAAWLASLVHADGAVTFAIDPRSRRCVPFGEMHHGRVAVVLQALAAHGGRSALVARVKRRLERDIRSGLAGHRVNGWPETPELVAATMALAILAGVPLQDDLAAFIQARQSPESSWHAAQVVAALGPRAPPSLWALCVADLARRPFAPWTVLAADAVGDRAVRVRAARQVATAIRKEAPHRGGASITPTPETAVTALAVEALARHEAAWAAEAVARGRGFLGAMQLLDRRLTAALDPALSYGAFSASPSADLLRCDITAHALLAMLPPSDRGRAASSSWSRPSIRRRTLP